MIEDEGSVLTRESLTRMYEMMDETNMGSFWVELTHMEANGFDIARQKYGTRYFIKSAAAEQGLDWDSLTEQQEREIALEVRRQLRRELEMVPLTAAEEAAWTYTAPKYRFAFDGEKRDFSDADIKLVCDWIRENDPLIAPYLTSVRAHNVPFGFYGGRNDHLMIRAGWAAAVIEAAFGVVFGSECPDIDWKARA